MPTLYKIIGFIPTYSAITLYTHKLWDRRYFFNRKVSYWLQSSITGSAFRGLLLILQKNSMLTDTKIFRSRMVAFRGTCLRRPLGTRRPPRLFEKLESYCIKLASLITRYSVLIYCAKEKKMRNKQQKGFASGKVKTPFSL